MAIKENFDSTKKSQKKNTISRFFGELKSEVKRITWPSKKDSKKALIAVGVVVIIFIMYVGGLDYIFQNLFGFILK